MFQRITRATAFALALGAAPIAAQETEIIRAHGYSFYGDLSYPADFAHFNYVNPDAPKGGTIALSAQGTFDSMNPFTRKGRAGALSSSMYESLLETSEPMGGGLAPADAYGEYYGLLAHTVEYPASKEWVIFHMRPEARFSDGTPVTAHDVAFSHNLFIEQGLPSYSQAVSQRVLNVEVLDDHRVKFTFADEISRRSLIDQVASTPVFSKAWYEETGSRLDESRMDISPGSGPYMLDGFEVNRSITYKRNPDYWGADLPNNVGRHNFDEIRIEYFADGAAAFEGFKSGIYTFRAENNSRQWATGYDFPAVDDGYVVRDELPTGLAPTPTGFVFNLGREIFQDPRVREAISLAFNFEWTNETLQYGLFEPRASYTQGTRLQAEGPPKGLELALLESLGDLVPPAMLTEPARMPHTSSAERLADRRNIRRAKGLLEDAGWAVDDSGALRNAAGEQMVIEIPVSSAGSATMDSIVETFTQNLGLLGIDAQFQRIDAAQHTDRRRNRDYDMIFDQYGAFMDTGTGLNQRYGSETAEFSLFNPAGLASPLVDAIIDASLNAPTPEERDAALMALDRALRHELIMVPAWYNDTVWVAYWDMFKHPETIPPFSTGQMDFWWYDADRAAELRAAGALR
ncbi:Periplasmic oligopeptide-binding protein [Roseibaca ekhonensis]|jgi:microcin C transport system substrate-binding protein|uniref:Periplasmic oligopeptide-binding protein n=1 Tax=Roseinatronobacter ekhonensis TaxID=254356 RepID=A0A3B0MJV6_9RHOB|nr:extracellular solute-binding protein [Roseibaca ekhonensis]SUZ31347.1 Periplasmic oligopeptide-binding protein [Roseibaca ekhonensis]